jgi:hypothetical protein
MRQLLRTPTGKIAMSILIGFGIATLFRKTCKDKKCMEFKGPTLEEIKERVYRKGKKCYQFDPTETKCSSHKKTVMFA